jgi:hypothetical protein
MVLLQIHSLRGVVGANRLLLGDAFFGHELALIILLKTAILTPNGFTSDSQINSLIGVVGANRLLLGAVFFAHEMLELALIILLKIKYLLRMVLPLIRKLIPCWEL